MLDENLVDTLHYLGIYGLIMLSTVITVSVTIVYFSIFAGVLIIVTLIMLAFYLPAATQLKKHKADSAGQLVGLVAETLEGLNVINAYGERVARRRACPSAASSQQRPACSQHTATALPGTCSPCLRFRQPDAMLPACQHAFILPPPPAPPSLAPLQTTTSTS